MSAIVEDLRLNILHFIEETRSKILDGSIMVEVTIPRLESCVAAIGDMEQIYTVDWAADILAIFEPLILIFESFLDPPQKEEFMPGRPKIKIPFSTLEYLLSLNFKLSEMSKMLGVSTSTISRRLAENGTSTRASYSSIQEEELSEIVLDILNKHPNTGYKRMKGYLLVRGIKLTDKRVRDVMRIVDPVGVYQRTIERNHVIRRRQYFVQYSNQLWHIDGNLKLIRWGIVIRGAIDGKSRTVTYLAASNNNKAETHLESFIGAVQTYGLPLHTRSDKGGENVLIAKFMIDNRGTGRASHICGRSVHNQRIERYWRDVRTGCTWIYRSVFEAMEDEGLLDIDNEKHLKLLHRIFIPRINDSLREFMNGWNSHPLSTESNHSPTQLMIMNLPPPNMDLTMPADIDTSDLFFNDNSDLVHFQEESITSPSLSNLSNGDIRLPHDFDLDKPSNVFGYDVFAEAKQYLCE